MDTVICRMGACLSKGREGDLDVEACQFMVKWARPGVNTGIVPLSITYASPSVAFQGGLFQAWKDGVDL